MADRRSPRRVGLALLALAGTLLVPSAALADTRTEARKHFKNGMKLVAEKNFSEGIKELEKAYEILPHPNVLYNIAQAQAEGGSLELAVRAYKNYLKEDPPDREKVQGIVKQLEDRIAAEKAEADAKKAKPQEPEPKPGEPKPGEPKPGEPKPGEPKPGEPKPGEPKPGEKPGEPKVGGPDAKSIVGDAKKDDIYEEQVFTASRGAQSPLDAPNSTTIITRQDIQLSGITRIPELLRRVAGMDVMQITAGDSNVSMRGGNSRLSNKLLVLINGRSAYTDTLGATLWESFSIDVDQIERIEIVRGPGSALYGANAVAGVVNIITRAPGEGGSGVRVGAGDGFQGYGSAWMSGRKGDFAFRASGGYTRYPRWSREVSDDRKDLVFGGLDSNLGAENIRGHLDASYRLPGGVEIIAGGGFARSNLDIYGIGPFNDYRVQADNAEGVIELRSKNFNAKTYYNRLTLVANQGYAYKGQPLYVTRPEQNIFHAELEYVRKFRWPKIVEHDFHLGASYRLKDIRWDYLQTDTPIESHGAAFIQDTLAIDKWVRIVASGRFDYVPYLQTVVPSPRLSVIVKPTEKQSVRILGSTAFRQPTFLEAYLDLPIQLTIPGLQLNAASTQPDLATQQRLKPENVVAAEVGYMNQEWDFLSLELNAFYNRLSDLIILADARSGTLSSKKNGVSGYDPLTGKYGVAFSGWQNQCETFNVFGGELGAKFFPVDGLDIFANYALNVAAIERPAGCPATEDQRTSMHKVNLGVQLRTKIGFNGEITFHYQSDQIWAERVATLAGVVTQPFPLKEYALLNARVGWKFVDKVEVAATVYNALADVAGDPAQQHPFGNRIGRRVMGFLTYTP